MTSRCSRKGRVVLDVLGTDVPLGQPNGGYQGYVGPLTLQSIHLEYGAGATRVTSTDSAYGIEPSVDYFITDHLTIGGRVGIAWEESRQYEAEPQSGDAWLFASFSRGINAELAPRVGYAIPHRGLARLP